jgi:putative ABC transport system substrate-binding protein
MSFTNVGLANVRRAASYVARVLNGEKPAQMPMEQPTQFQLVINLRTARDIGIAVPQAIVSRATRVIE